MADATEVQRDTHQAHRPARTGGNAPDPAQAKYDSIHRALLAGLLGNIGARSKSPHEYEGCRGRKFHLFPGSSLFRKEPHWVMAAELSETTRLYARTVARLNPEWIERVAEHLLQRSYTEPHWNRDMACVHAYERITLHGLVIVPRRRVHYGPINPKESREIFIRQALVEGEYRTDAPWRRHNLSLLREVELIEAKLRRRDVLADPASRFAFYDARIPAGIYNGPLFEKWRRQAEGRNRGVLFMNREEVMPSAPVAPADLLPDAIELPEFGGLRLPLRYYYETGDEADGVTVTIPVAALGQIPAERIDWLVPGWLEEKIAALIKTLPKEFRVHFIPAPDTAKAVAPALRFGEGDLIAALAWQLGKRSEVHVPRDAWQPDAVPDWLRMNIRVIDESGRVIEMGRHLGEIRRKLRTEVRQTLATMPAGPWHRDGIARWDFDDLPETAEVRRPGLVLRGYPCLVDAGQSVSLRLADTPAGAAASTRAGLRRLFILQVGKPIEQLAKNLPGISAMSLNYATIGPGDALRRDLINVITDRALFDDDLPGQMIRSRDAFISRAESGWQRLGQVTSEVCTLVASILQARQDLTRRLGSPFPPMLHPSITDMRQQLADLLSAGFVASTPYGWLKQIPRYLKGIEMRLNKLTNAGAVRDGQAMGEVKPYWEQYLRRREWQRNAGIDDPVLVQFRWMIEELRVSLFAQDLKTSVPVSSKRLDALWEMVAKGV